MADVALLGVGLGGMLSAFQLASKLLAGDALTPIGQGSRNHFVPSNSWVAMGRRTRPAIEAAVIQQVPTTFDKEWRPS
jgi:sulfide:quinone oxidoreductase